MTTYTKPVLQRIAAGTCIRCGDPRVHGSAWHCAKHHEEHRANSREWYRSNRPHVEPLRRFACGQCGLPGHNARTCPRVTSASREDRSCAGGAP